MFHVQPLVDERGTIIQFRYSLPEPVDDALVEVSRDETERRVKVTLYYQKTRPRLREVASRGVPIVIVQHSAEFLLASDSAHLGQ